MADDPINKTDDGHIEVIDIIEYARIRMKKYASSRELALANTKLEEAIMWIERHVKIQEERKDA